MLLFDDVMDLSSDVPVLPSDIMQAPPSIHRISNSTLICGLGTAGPRIVARIIEGVPHGLTDSGANLCMTNDPSLLLNVGPCHPFHIDQATSDGTPSASNVCDRVGLLPIPLVNGSVYYQPTFVNTHAAGTFISPQAIIDGSRNQFSRWVQSNLASPMVGQGSLKSSAVTARWLSTWT